MEQLSPELLREIEDYANRHPGESGFVKDGKVYQAIRQQGSGEDNSFGPTQWINVYDYTPGGTPTGTQVNWYRPDGTYTNTSATTKTSFGSDLAKWAVAAGAMAFGIPALMGAGISAPAAAGAAGAAGSAGAAGAGAAAAGAAGAAAAGGAGAAGAAGAAGGLGGMASYLGPAASIAGSLIGANSASRAADAQRGATESANALLRDQFGQVRADLAPYRAYGEQSLNALAQRMGLAPGGAENGSLLDNFTGEDLASEPGYAFGLNEGNKALDRRFASGGNYFSGAALKGATRYAQDYASQKYNEAFQRDAANKNRIYDFLSGGTRTGQNSATQTAETGMRTAGQIGANTTGMGNALGGAAIAQGNALASGLSGVASDYRQREMLESFNQRNNLLDRIYAGNSGWGGGESWRNTGNGMPYDYRG